MSKKTKKLRKQHLEVFADWLSALSPEQLGQVRTSARLVRPSFRAVVEAKALVQNGSEES